VKTLPANLAAHVATRSTTLATALKITRTDGAVFGFTTHDVEDVVAGVPYKANPGLAVTDIVTAANAAVGNLELTTLHDGTTFTTSDVLGGVWRNASFILFRYNWASIADGIDTLMAGTLGEFELRQNTVIAELRDLRQYLQQSVGNASSKTCRARLGDARCAKVLTSFTYAGTLTGVTSNQVFTASARTEAAGWFDAGQITFTSGANIGRSAKIKSFASGTFTLALPLYGTVAIGDAYSVVAGCRKRLEEDCVAKFANALNFQGEPHRQGINSITKAPA
jgi:uncharacterized phage protein (TIGR02218 family)